MAYTTINKGSDYFNTVLYSGNAGTQSITGVGFQPDFTWVKRRSGATSHGLTDSVRGAGLTLFSDTTGVEQDYSAYFTSFDSDGFSLAIGGNVYNASGSTYASWNWLAGGTASSNTDGDITSSVSANTTSGFSIVSYTGNGSAGSTVGHGLSQAPNMIISKRRSGTSNWQVGHDGLTSWDYYLQGLDTTNAQSNSNNVWNDTAPSSSFYTVGTNVGTNSSGSTYIAYCFHSVKGFSKFGSYTGNGSTDGTFVYTGFKPAFVIMKRTNTTGEWGIFDDKRNTFNVATSELKANASDAEEINGAIDFLSNGFKLRDTALFMNGSGSTYIYMAFAENPFVSSTGTPVTAR